MDDQHSAYDVAAIRKLLMAAFTPDDLRRFCQDRPSFQPIVDRFSPNHGLDGMVDEVITYCGKWLLFSQLLDQVRRYNPGQYERHCPYWQKSPGGDSHGGNRPLWLIVGPVIAALILVGVYLLFLRNPPVRVTLKTAHGRYVAALGVNSSWRLTAESDKLERNGEFTLLCRHDGKVALQACRETDAEKPRYVTPLAGDFDWELKAQADKIETWEEFTLLDPATVPSDTRKSDAIKSLPCSDAIRSLRKDGQIRVAFKTWHEKEGWHRLVTAMDGSWREPWVLRAETNELYSSEIFIITLIPNP